MADSWRPTRLLFTVYWVPNAVFVLFFGFTWQILVGFLVSMAASLYLTIVTLEAMVRARPVAVVTGRAS